MSLISPVESHWVDIVPPGTPPTHLDPFALIIAVITFSVLLVSVVVYYRRPRQRAKRALRKIAQELREARIDTKSAAFAIARHLRLGLGRRRLHSGHRSDRRWPDWEIYVQELTSACFAPLAPSRAEMERIAQGALVWLERIAPHSSHGHR